MIFFLEFWFLHIKTMKTEIKRFVQLLLCYYSPVIFTLLKDSALWIHATICPGPGHYFIPTLWQLCPHQAACLPCSLLDDGIPPVPYGQINLPFQQSSGSYGAQWCLTWLALNLMNLKAIWAGPFICSFSTPHGEYISTPPFAIPSHLSCLHISFPRKLRGGRGEHIQPQKLEPSLYYLIKHHVHIIISIQKEDLPCELWVAYKSPF